MNSVYVCTVLHLGFEGQFGQTFMFEEAVDESGGGRRGWGELRGGGKNGGRDRGKGMEGGKEEGD